MSRRLRKGDEVVVIAGTQKGRKGRVVEVLNESDRVRVEGVASAKRHVKPGRDPKLPNGGIVDKLASIHASNVMPVDPSTGKGTRVKSKTLDDGTRVRVGMSGEMFKDATS
ncbi:MAG: 50S ribosomal protein L24 [Clostridia bacterium]|nr:50S ribosomal protein L24 [Deltaproteobacteria bacterium]